MAKILIISAVFPPEPVVSAILSQDIAEQLSTSHEVVVISPQPTRPEGFAFNKAVSSKEYKVVRLDSFTCAPSSLFGRFRESYSFGNHCTKFIKANAATIDGIYLNSWPLLAQFKVIKIAKKLKIPCVIHVQDIYPESLTNKLPKLLRGLFSICLMPIDIYILKNATRILGISPNMISYLSKRRKIDIGKFKLIRNWQNDDQFLNHVSNSEQKKDFVFMYVGSISASAGVTSLIAAFCKAELQNSKLVIAGDGADKKKCIELATQFGNAQIEFCDVVPENVPAIQSKSDVLLLPLKKGIAQTATPSKLTAYLLSSKPVIACVELRTDVANTLSEANCGFVVEPENVDAIAEVMQKVYKLNKSELEKLGFNGREYAILNLSKQANLQKVVSIIENIV